MSDIRYKSRSIALLSELFFGYTGLRHIYLGQYYLGAFRAFLWLIFSSMIVLVSRPVVTIEFTDTYIFGLSCLGILIGVWWLFELASFSFQTIDSRTWMIGSIWGKERSTATVLAVGCLIAEIFIVLNWLKMV